jgi:hypothetical protein
VTAGYLEITREQPLSADNASFSVLVGNRGERMSRVIANHSPLKRVVDLLPIEAKRENHAGQFKEASQRGIRGHQEMSTAFRQVRAVVEHEETVASRRQR